MISVESTNNAQTLSREIAGAISGVDLLRAGLKGAEIIKDRTGRGLDFRGDEFTPYGRMATRLREERGLPVDHVDLFFSGNMLASMDVASIPAESTLGFRSLDEAIKALKHNTGEDVPMREFFDLADVEIDDIIDIIADSFDRGLQNGG